MFYSWNEKEFLIFRYLLKNPTTNLREIEEELQISHMTIRNGINNINDFLKKNNLELIQKIDSSVIFPIGNIDNLNIKCDFFYTNIERFDYLLLKLIFQKDVVLNTKMDTLGVSRKTLESILKSIRTFLNTYNLQIESQAWTGYHLEGTIESKIRLATEFIASLWIFKELNPSFYKMFDIDNSNIVYKELYHFIDKTDVEETKKFVKVIFEKIEYDASLFSFYLIVSFILVLNLFKPNPENLSSLNKSNQYTKAIVESISEYPNFIFLRRYINSLGLALTTLNSKSASLNEDNIRIFKKIEKKFNFKISKESLKKLDLFIKISKYKKKFNLRVYNLKLHDFPNIYQESIISIKDNLIDYFPEIYLEDILPILLELKNNISDSINFKKNVLLVDSYTFSSFAEETKTELLSNYKVDNVEVISIFTNINQNRINNKFDIVFILSHSTDLNSRLDNLEIPVYKILGNEFLKNRYFFNNFKIQSKL
ncbi:MAG: helix-turn-helix domain-containing protein [Cetobacterium sp.]|uniref:helix-turn-helix domain-containing protein n=1 Tax=Cetobacterium sp. TaxID=2071632 RepID=UPI003EE46E83